MLSILALFFGSLYTGSPFLPQETLSLPHTLTLQIVLGILITTRLNTVIDNIQKLKVKPATIFLLSFLFSIFIPTRFSPSSSVARKAAYR